MRKANLAVWFSMLILSSLTLVFSSCSKDPLQPTAAPTTATSSNVRTATPTEESTLTTVSTIAPGLYKVLKFIEKGKDETAQFYGYTFKFQSDGVLIATTRSGQVVKGKWWLNSTKTRLLIDISGTEGFNDVDEDNWKVEVLTATNIKLSLTDPVIIEFVKI